MPSDRIEPLFDSHVCDETCAHTIDVGPLYGMSDEEYARAIADAQSYRRHARAARLRQNHE